MTHPHPHPHPQAPSGSDGAGEQEWHPAAGYPAVHPGAATSPPPAAPPPPWSGPAVVIAQLLATVLAPLSFHGLFSDPQYADYGEPDPGLLGDLAIAALLLAGLLAVAAQAAVVLLPSRIPRGPRIAAVGGALVLAGLDAGAVVLLTLVTLGFAGGAVFFLGATALGALAAVTLLLGLVFAIARRDDWAGMLLAGAAASLTMVGAVPCWSRLVSVHAAVVIPLLAIGAV